MASKRPGEDENNGHAAAGDGPDAKKAKSAAPAGVVLFSGATDWDEVGRKTTSLPRSKNTVWNPKRLAALADVKVEFVSSGPCSVHMFAITDEGAVYAWGRNEKGQLGLGDTKDRRCPTLVNSLSGHRVVKAATGKNHSLFLTDQGKVLACGDNKAGQTVGGAGTAMNKVPQLINYDGPPIVRIACGADFSVILDVTGNIWTWGHPEYGQLGHNSEGQYLEKAGKVLFHYVFDPTKVVMFIEKDPRSKQVSPVPGVTIKEISCGSNHTVAIDEKYRAFSWGFGGYGRLGHSETGNELVPRLIKFLDGPRRGIKSVVAGGQFNVALSEIPGTAYMWGQYTSAKEANMYPKPITDLSGWNIRSIACSGKGWMVACDETVIGCSPSPCFGELAMGENKKSSAQPVEIKTLDKVYILQCGMGISHSLFIARCDSDDDKKAIEKYDVLDQSALDK
jgi:alpha-tubulin suppressor-like RCC1 family protein